MKKPLTRLRQSLALLCLLSTMYVGTAHARVILIPDDYPTFASAKENLQEGDTLVFQPGTYYETLVLPEVNHLTIGSQYLLTGDTTYVSKTILDGEQERALIDASWSRGKNLRISGLTLTHAYSNATNAGSAITTINIEGLGIDHCNINSNEESPEKDNNAHVFLKTCTNVEINLCKFLNNAKGRVLHFYNENGICEISNCVFCNNESGAIYNYAFKLRLVNNVFNKNEGGFISVDHGEFICLNNLVANNGCGVVYTTFHRFDSYLINNIFIENRAYEVAVTGGKNYMFNNIFIHNNSRIFIYGTEMSPNIYLKNNIIADAKNNTTVKGDGFNRTLHWLTGNTSEKPIFRDTTNFDFRPHSTSPAVDAGYYDETDTVFSDINLMEIHPIIGSSIDIGAYEFDPSVVSELHKATEASWFTTVYSRNNKLLKIELDEKDKLKKVEIFSIEGKRIASSYSSEINCSDIPTGIYLIKVTNNHNQTQSKKVFIY